MFTKELVLHEAIRADCREGNCVTNEVGVQSVSSHAGLKGAKNSNKDDGVAA